MPNANATFENEAREVRARVARLVAQLGNAFRCGTLKRLSNLARRQTEEISATSPLRSGRTDPCLYR